MASAVSRPSSQSPWTSAPRPQRASRRRPSRTNSAGARCAARASRASLPLSHSQSRPSAPAASPPASRPRAQPSRVSRCRPSRLASAQNTLTGRWPSPSAAKDSPAPLARASTSSRASASREPWRQVRWASSRPSRRPSQWARVRIRRGREPPWASAWRTASLSSSGPACSSRRRTASVSQRASRPGCVV